MGALWEGARFDDSTICICDLFSCVGIGRGFRYDHDEAAHCKQQRGDVIAHKPLAVGRRRY
jgi:hypothetical protein